jgi:hypothetical protein
MLMIWNIVDNRKRTNRWKIINARIEPTDQSNYGDSDRAPDQPGVSVYEEMIGVSVTDAITWAISVPYGVTLCLGDEGDHIDPENPEDSN